MPKIVRRHANENNQQKLSGHLPPLLQRIYAARDVSDMVQLDHELNQLLPYHDLLNIELATQYCVTMLQQQLRVLIIGDFDADGATSAALLVSVLRSFGLKEVNYLVPNRFEYGYGLTPEIVLVAKERNPDWIITVDNGISSHEGIAKAHELGMKVMVTDHHLPGDTLPPAEVIINPNQPGCHFASKALAGVGVAFYLLLALRASLRELNWFDENNIVEPNLAHALDIVALGTVADVVPLDRNNRILVYQGLKRMRLGRMRPGIRALLEASGRSVHQLVATDLGFGVGPRLNAAGRLDDMSLGIECLLTEDHDHARHIAEQLSLLNEERKQIGDDMQLQAMQIVQALHLGEGKDLPAGLCLYDRSWHQGVIGILASRIKEAYHRPVIAFAHNEGTVLKGSARSVKGVNIRDVLDLVDKRCPGVLLSFGGHAMAAGLSLNEKDFAAFSAAFAAEIGKCLTADDLQGVYYSDGELALDEYTLDMATQLREGGPWGQAFPEPSFDGEFNVLNQRIVGAKHLKLQLGFPGSHRILDAIYFNINTDEWPNRRAERVRAVYRLDVNEYQSKRNVQLMIEHLEAIT